MRSGMPVVGIGKLIFGCAFWVAIAGGQVLTVTPARILMDQSADIRATGLEQREHVVVKADLVDGEGEQWESASEFVADAQGGIDLAKEAPVKGSYKVVSAMGPIWSMMPVNREANIYHAPHGFAPQKSRFELVRDGKTVASAELEQTALVEGVRQIKVTGHLHGTVFVPAGDGPHPGVLVLGGSEGGMPSRRAAWLASHGYVAFALAYFRYEDLPKLLEAIPLEYFGQALGWLRERPEVSADRIAVMGVSRGGELALQLGSMFPQIKAV